jgi:predicted hydrocarbon binding protein
MKKREFLKTCCGLGICSCAATLLPASDPAKTENVDSEEMKKNNVRLNWRLNHAKRQMSLLLCKIEPEISPQVRCAILEDMGRSCAKSLGWALKYKGNPEGFFEHMKKHSGENLTFDKERKKITIITRDRDCDCPIVDSAKTPGYYCNCSLGWQKETYETILGVPVSVEIKESVLRGAKRCVFEVTVTT